MTEAEAIDIAKKRLGKRSIVLVGLMGCGKSSIGKRLAFKLGLPFIDADEEIERAAAKTINDIFADHGEAHFRDGERKVIARLLRDGPQVLATGGGAYMHPETRQRIREKGVSVWLRADLPVLMRRVMKRDTRPLLRDGNAEATMRKLIESRYPIYAEADMTVDSRDEPHDLAVAEIVNRLAAGGHGSSANAQNPSPSRSVRVELGERSYDVLIANGLLADTGALIKSRLGAVKCGIVTDANVARHHLATLEDSLKAEGLFAGSVVMTPGEATKSFRDLAELSERLLEMGLERGDLIVPLGGGVIGDLAGFAAGILRRGVRFVQIPTSLLAQVDSSVGGKTGINTPQGKNLIGVFHQPSLVIADTAVLTTLPPRQMRAGYAEVAKYGLLGDAKFFSWLETNWPSVFGNNGPALTHAIETSVAAKARIVARDETETGDRALLNLGHTFGHAFEAWTGYSDKLLHGEGIAIGMCLAFRLSEELGVCSHGRAERVEAHFKAVGLPTKISDIPQPGADAGELQRLMGQDKKVKGGKLAFILARDIGDSYVSRDVPPETVRGFLTREIAR
ncbi:3-dehydroquinate synthase [Hyphomicrobium sp.]|jgi:shikimate kinase/3-dehydroquinate synthase|uniref:3-dehydroquinate synthase n=1 Tax=Hyphomicrobium sp. TaxID=82 RepID=UPI002CFA633F|nr:3-dehydroquinate synthase [Hyphomicrobium sp.]HVZ04792.1 3-dehydroquinate synthase [Hyphomicrobium sp.]